MIRKMLRLNPNERPTADELMESPWFQRLVRAVPLPGNSLNRCFKELYYYNVPYPLFSANLDYRKQLGSSS